MSRTRVGILMFNEVEVLDFAGPFEVFSLAESVSHKEKLFEVFTIAETKGVISASNGLQILPGYAFSDAPEMDILIVPGGYGAEEIEIKNRELLHWLTCTAAHVKTIASICTGAFLLAESGIISTHKVTTHWMDIDSLQRRYPSLSVEKNVRFIDQGKILTSAGISAGIELSLYIIEQYFGKDVARTTAKRMEYHYNF